MNNVSILGDLVIKYPALSGIRDEIGKAADIIKLCFLNGGKLLICGNGGSSSDSDHIVGELMKGFEQKRHLVERVKEELILKGGDRGKYLAEKLQQGLPAISLSAHSGLISAISNDTDADLIFAQQVIGYGNQGDILLALSTSGNSQNILDAIITAKAKGMTVIGMTGETGGKMASECDILINVPGKSTASVQELHLPVYHALCLMIETSLFGNIK
jgi:D-sedoheptulose 7-phosphate isomerase